MAFFDIAEEKSPGPDGYSSGFFKAAWPIVGEEVTRAILDFFHNGKMLRQVNHIACSHSQDCKPLFQRVDERIKGWEGIPIIADRVQLIQSVLMALNAYWAMAFILPKGIIRKVEKLLRTFLWKGQSRADMPRSHGVKSAALRRREAWYS
ncbi:UNVERIFIED_CONTAM: hypothetical protein Sradi_4400200 [Sesamum radiatum]|uniref:Reverse transcriptase n=1 Tax=Sesamum radiatum TaxID=300843 RepID=A0AAW2NQ74_SESRA